MSFRTEHIKFLATKSSGEVSGIIIMPEKAECFLVLALGAGAGMNHTFMHGIAIALAELGVGTLRFNFPYSEKNLKRPDPAPILIETVYAAVNKANEYYKNIPLFAGGKSLGGRMTSTAASKKALANIRGIAFFGFPLHAPGKASNERAEHLFQVSIPMLFLQGTNDKLADLNLLQPVVNKLNNKATLHIIEGADHSFHVPKKSGKTDDEIIKELALKFKEWAIKIK
jgi:predicted alpha/beta-hydrolase family hydrolase